MVLGAASPEAELAARGSLLMHKKLRDHRKSLEANKAASMRALDATSPVGSPDASSTPLKASLLPRHGPPSTHMPTPARSPPAVAPAQRDTASPAIAQASSPRAGPSSPRRSRSTLSSSSPRSHAPAPGSAQTSPHSTSPHSSSSLQKTPPQAATETPSQAATALDTPPSPSPTPGHSEATPLRRTPSENSARFSINSSPFHPRSAPTPARSTSATALDYERFLQQQPPALNLHPSPASAWSRLSTSAKTSLVVLGGLVAALGVAYIVVSTACDLFVSLYLVPKYAGVTDASPWLRDRQSLKLF